MREILFRAKSGQTWCYGYVHKDYESTMPNKWRLTTAYGDVKVINSDTISEWTGLLDKNNVMIFEGDIVKANRYKRSIDTDTFTIEFVEGNYYLCYDGCTAWTLRTFIEELEVIGNIYDNPELVKE